MRAAFAIPGDLDTRTGGYAYDRALLSNLRTLGITVDHVALPGSFPEPTALDIDASVAALSALPEGTVALVDGLAYALLPAEQLARVAAPLVALVHHPLADETGLSQERQRAFMAAETAALEKAAAVVTTSQTTARRLSNGFGVPTGKITVARPGLHPAAYQANHPAAPPSIVSVGSLIPRKGFDVLLAAMNDLEDVRYAAHIVGSLERHPATARTLIEYAERPALAGRVRFHGECDDEAIRGLFSTATVFALPSRHEGFGMVYAEAMAAGLPVVACRAGAVPEVVPDSAGILVPVDDTHALANALRLLLVDRDTRDKYAAGARTWAAGLPGWPQTARDVAATLATCL